MAVEPGQSLLHNRLVEPIGAGGVGVVWRATDTRLDRDAAVKALPEDFADDRRHFIVFVGNRLRELEAD